MLRSLVGSEMCIRDSGSVEHQRTRNYGQCGYTNARTPTHLPITDPTAQPPTMHSSTAVAGCGAGLINAHIVFVLYFINRWSSSRKREKLIAGTYTKIVPVWAHFDAPSSPNLAFVGPILALIGRRACVERACGRGGSGAFGGRRSSAGHTETGIVGKSHLDMIITTFVLYTRIYRIS